MSNEDLIPPEKPIVRLAASWSPPGTPDPVPTLELDGVFLRATKLEVTGVKRFGRDPIYITHTACRSNPMADLWAIRSLGGDCYGRDGWEMEPSGSDRDDDFFQRCRWTLAEAVRAVQAAGDE